MPEYMGIAAEYQYDFTEAWKNSKKLKDVHAYIVRKLAAERNWEYREDPKVEDENFPFRSKPHGYKTCIYSGDEFRLEDNAFAMALLYKPKERLDNLLYEAVLFHWPGDRSYCHAFVCPIYSPPEDPSGYYERRNIAWKMQDGCIYCCVRDVYADSADIQDHDHFVVEAGFCYDPEKKELRYYIPD